PSGEERVIYTSPGCVDVWEVPPEAFSRSPEALWDAMHPDDRPRIRATVDESIRTLTAWSGIWRIRTPSGAEKWLQGFGAPARGRDGGLAFVAVVFDIRGAKRAEDAARAACSRLAHV